MEPMGADPIGMDELIIGGGMAPPTMDGLNVRAKIAPIKPRRKPMKYPPIAVTQLRIASIKTMTPHILVLVGLEYIITDPRIMIIPIITPTSPRASRVLLAAPAPAMLSEETIEPANARVAPPNITNNPPINDRTIAAVGFSPM